MNYLLIFMLIVFILVICSSLFVSCNNALPHYMDTIFQKHSGVEGFSNNSNTLDYSSQANHSAMDTYKPFLIEKPAAECKKVYGFTGLFCEPSSIDNPLDKFGGLEGKLECKDNSGLTNSRGGLCLTDEHKKLLSTRGGNMGECKQDIGE